MANEMVTKSGRFYCSSLTPDICKTPVGNSTPPIPYSIIGEFSDATGVSSNIKSHGDYVVVHADTVIPSVKGDAPGSADGIKSGTVGKRVQHDKKSRTVKFNSQKAVRVNDTVFMNDKNTSGAIFERGSVPEKSRIKAEPGITTKPADSEKKSFGDKFDDAVSDAGKKIKGAEDYAAGKVQAFANTSVGSKVMGAVSWVDEHTSITALQNFKTGLETGVDQAVADSGYSTGMMVAGSLTKAALSFVPTSALDLVPGGEGKAAKAASEAEHAAAAAAKAAKEADEAAKLAKKAEQAEHAAQDAEKAKKPEGEHEPPPDGEDGAKSKPKEGEGEPCKALACLLEGNPVNPIFGCKILSGPEDVDFRFPGILPLIWQRSYSSDNPVVGWLGQGWNLPFSMALEVGSLKVRLLDELHRGISFDLPSVGQTKYNAFEKVSLTRVTETLFRMTDADAGRTEFMLPSPTSNRAPLVRILDRNDNAITLWYDPATLLPHTIVDSAGRRYGLLFSDANRLIGVTDGSKPFSLKESNLRLVSYEYDAAGDLVRIRDRSGNVTREFAYRNHVMVRHSRPGGLVSEYAYDEYSAQGKVMRNWNNVGQSWRFDYDTRETTVTDNLERTTRYIFNQAKHLIGNVNAVGNKTTRNVDRYGNLTEFIDAAGQKTRYWFDGRSRIKSIKEADGGSTSIDYDDRFDLPSAITDANGATTTLKYDDRGNVIEVVDALNQSTRYTLDSQGLVETMIDARGGIKKFSYDAAGQVTSFTDCSGQTTQYEYDSTGNLIRATDPLNQSTYYQYDSGERVVAIRNPDDSYEYFQYDTLGRLVVYTDPQGERTSYSLDADGKPLTRTNALGSSLEYRYDPARRLVQLVNENSTAYSFGYDKLDHLIEETGFDGRKTRYCYDAVGMPTGKFEFGTEVDAKGQIQTSFKFDPIGRLLERIVARGDVTPSEYILSPRSKRSGEKQSHSLSKVTERLRTRFAYDKVGRLITARNEEALVEFKYDDIGQLIEEMTINHGITSVVGHQYDELGNRIQTALPDGRVINRLYYGSGHLHQINIDGEVISDFERDQAHREISRSQGALVSRYGYDPMGRLRAQVAQFRQTTTAQTTDTKGKWEAMGDMPNAQDLQGRVVARRYDYDKSGNLTAILDKRFGVTQYRYDAMGRVLGATNRSPAGATVSETFSFDPAHNILGAVSQDGTSNNGNIIRNNRLTVFEDKRYEYDSHGNLIGKRVGKHTDIKLEWDAQHRLRTSQVSRSANHYRPVEQTTHYGYDPLGRRLFKRDAFGITRFVWDGPLLLSETRGAKTKTYIYEPDSFVPLAQVNGNFGKEADAEARISAELLYFHTDHLGTPRELTDQQGNLRWAATYRAWGNVLRVEVPTPPPRTTIPLQKDEEKSVEQPFRFQGQYHDDETGLSYNRFRYYDPDCGRFVSQDPIGLEGGINLYQYAPNPITWVDPWGLDCSSDAEKLAKNLGAAPGVDHRAHHMVMSNSTDSRMEALRKMMTKFGLDKNAAENGIWLPKNPAARLPGSKRTAHGCEGVHGDAYKQYVYDKLKNSKNADEFETGLAAIRKDLMNGKTFPVK